MKNALNMSIVVGVIDYAALVLPSHNPIVVSFLSLKHELEFKLLEGIVAGAVWNVSDPLVVVGPCHREATCSSIPSGIPSAKAVQRSKHPQIFTWPRLILTPDLQGLDLEERLW